MALFEYETLSCDGKKHKGVIEADSLADARKSILLRSEALIKLRPAPLRRGAALFSKEGLFVFMRQFARLLSAKLPLYEALLTLEEKYRGHKAHPVLLDLCTQIKEGKSLYKALRAHPQNFDFVMCAMVENAEKIGRLSGALEEISVLLSKQLQVKKQLQKALIYPAILSVFCLVLIFALLFFVIPSLFDLFEGRPLHPFTTLVLNCSRFAREYKILLFSSLSAAACCLALSKVRAKFFNLVMKFPIFYNLAMKMAIVRFSRSMAALLFGGVPYLHALHLSIKMVGLPPLELLLRKAEEKVTEGVPLCQYLKHNGNLPPLFVRMLSIAQTVGDEPGTLLNIALLYEDELEKQFEQLLAILQPAILLILGVVIGFVVLAILLPLTDVSSFLGG